MVLWRVLCGTGALQGPALSGILAPPPPALPAPQLERCAGLELALLQARRGSWTRAQAASGAALRELRARWAALHPLAHAGRAALLAQLQMLAELEEVCSAVRPPSALLGPGALEELSAVAAAWGARRPVAGPGAAGFGGQAAAEAVHCVLGARGVLLDAMERAVVAQGGQAVAVGTRRAAVGREDARLQLQAAQALAGLGFWDSAEGVLNRRRERLAQMVQLTRQRVAPELVLPGLALQAQVQAAKLAAAGPGAGAGRAPAAALESILGPLADERQQAEGQPALVLQALLAQAQANAALAGQGHAEQRQRVGWASGAARTLQQAAGLQCEGAAAAAAQAAAAHVQHALLCYQLALALQEPAAGGSGQAQQPELPPLQQLEPDVQAELAASGGPAAAAVASLLAALAGSGGTSGEARARRCCSTACSESSPRASWQWLVAVLPTVRPPLFTPAPCRLARPARGAHAATAGAGLPGLWRRRRRARLQLGLARRAAGHLPALGPAAALPAGRARGRRAVRAAAGGRPAAHPHSAARRFASRGACWWLPGPAPASAAPMDPCPCPCLQALAQQHPQRLYFPFQLSCQHWGEVCVARGLGGQGPCTFAPCAVPCPHRGRCPHCELTPAISCRLAPLFAPLPQAGQARAAAAGALLQARCALLAEFADALEALTYPAQRWEHYRGQVGRAGGRGGGGAGGLAGVVRSGCRAPPRLRPWRSRLPPAGRRLCALPNTDPAAAGPGPRRARPPALPGRGLAQPVPALHHRRRRWRRRRPAGPLRRRQRQRRLRAAPGA